MRRAHHNYKLRRTLHTVINFYILSSKMVNFTASSSNLTNTAKETNSTMQDKKQVTFSVPFLSINIIINIITCPFTVGLNALVIIAIKRRPRLQSNANV